MTPLTYSPLDKMQSDIQLAAFRYIACLKATPTNKDFQIEFEDTIFSFDSIRGIETPRLHADFQRWASISTLRDLVENFSIFLALTFREVVSENSGFAYSCTIEAFERRGIEDQLKTLAFDFGVEDAWVSRLVGFNRARNCLAHRDGIVGLRDLTNGKELCVRWLTSKTFISSNNPSQTVQVDGPMGHLLAAQHLSGGKIANFGFFDKERLVALGRPLRFEPRDIMEICQTFQLAAAAFSCIRPKNRAAAN